MNLIALTMLQKPIQSRNELHDSIDNAWVTFLSECKLLPLYLPNDAKVAKELLSEAKPKGVILTGGGDTKFISAQETERDRVEILALEWAVSNNIPVMGVCRGMQVILSYFGAKAHAVPDHVCKDHVIYSHSKQITVNSFHDYGFTTLPEGFKLMFNTADGVIEGASNEHGNIVTIMWHPERNKDINHTDVEIFTNLFQERSCAQ